MPSPERSSRPTTRRRRRKRRRKSRKRRRSTRLMSRTASARTRCVSTAALAAAFALAAAAQPATTAAPKPPVTLADATNAALQQVSAFQQAQIEESLAAEELRQARAALLPRARDSFSITYNSPEPGSVPPEPGL